MKIESLLDAIRSVTVGYLHASQGGVDGGAASLDSDDGVECTHRSLERLEVAVLVGENAEAAWVYTKTNTDMDVLLGRLEPGVALGLRGELACAREGRGGRGGMGEGRHGRRRVRQSCDAK